MPTKQIQFWDMDHKTPSPLPKCPKFSTDQHLGFCFDPLPPFGPMSQSLLFEGIPNLKFGPILVIFTLQPDITHIELILDQA